MGYEAISLGEAMVHKGSVTIMYIHGEYRMDVLTVGQADEVMTEYGVFWI